jgi:uncharacterized protein (DUF1800 family)
MYRAVYSNRQLEEVLIDYWFNHFNVDSTKNVGMTQNLGHVLIGSYERNAIRPHVLGHFKGSVANAIELIWYGVS